MAGNGLVQSVLKGIDTLEYLAHCENGATLQEISLALGMKPPTVHNFLRTWISRGYVERFGRPVRYRCGAACSRLGDFFIRNSRLQAVGDELLAMIAQCPGAVLNWSEINDGQIVVRLRIDPQQPKVIQRPAGQVLSGYTSAASVAFQAFGKEEQLASHCRLYPFWDFGARLWKDTEVFARILEETRERGYSRLELNNDPLIKCAAPVYDRSGLVAGIVGLAFDAGTPEESVSAGIRELQRAGNVLNMSCRS